MDTELFMNMSEEKKMEMTEGKPEQRQGNESLSESSSMVHTEATVEKKMENAEEKYQEILTKVSPLSSSLAHSNDEISLDTKSIRDTVDEESKIQKLLDLASTKGVVYAVKVARSIDDYYALDQIHDALANKLYEGLLKMGFINKE